MASRLPRIPRFTLFSGPNCSLCDVGPKSELAKVRQSRQFQLDIVNIQEPGQEKWKRRYVYWIPALHLDGKEIAKGRWDSSTITQALEPSGIYIRHSREILGYEETDEVPTNSNIHRCFNCGSPDHPVSLCPEPKDRELISMSRQLFELHQEPAGLADFRRLHRTEAWRQQRLDWLGLFKPGEVRGQLLREAIEPGEGDWLENIAIWGYPKGWALHSGSHDEQDLSVVLGENILGSRSQYLTDSSRESESSDNRRRWAEYPNTQFSAFPPVEFEGSSTYTAERRALWERITNPSAPSYPVPPPPPASSPPPPPPFSPPPLLPALPPHSLNSPRLPPPSSNAHDECDEVDMDLSD
ncbi:hypothetical protein DFS33DRAFT_1408008 [Desarmillaria ectypa]|nr:hypothetical protein DFS33DRAFT_1408008 [Desarmillaria ectypa]